MLFPDIDQSGKGASSACVMCDESNGKLCNINLAISAVEPPNHSKSTYKPAGKLVGAIETPNAG